MEIIIVDERAGGGGERKEISVVAGCGWSARVGSRRQWQRESIRSVDGGAVGNILIG